MHQIIRIVASLVLLASTANFGLAAELGVPVQPEWASAGQNNHNTRYAATEHTINAGNVGSLKPKWTFTTAGDVSATATVVNGVAYVPDWGGKLWAIDTKTGQGYLVPRHQRLHRNFRLGLADEPGILGWRTGHRYRKPHDPRPQRSFRSRRRCPYRRDALAHKDRP